MDPSRKVNHLSQVIWDRKTITEITSIYIQLILLITLQGLFSTVSIIYIFLFYFKNETFLVQRVLQFFIENFNLEPVKYVYIRFSIVLWLLRFVSHFKFLLEAKAKFINVCTKTWQNKQKKLYFCCLNVLIW